ncbi:MAG TPA: O-antigen ligase family protein [Vicinamibacterales bacterium]|nr:O-antigen ligase family protein [Vicinamibacterales bacterium]
MIAHRALLVVVVVGTFVAFGGMPGWTTVPVLAASLTLWAVATFRRPALGFTNAPLDLALLGLAGAVALQVVPLPASVVDVLSPAASGLESQLFVGAGGMGGGARPLTLDVSRTLASLATVVSAVLVFVATRSILHAGGTRALCRTLAFFGAVAGLAALGFRVAAPEHIFGFWQPEAISAKPLGPFVNRNHFAGWLLLILPVSAGYFVAQLSSRTGDGRVGTAMAAALNSRAAATGAAVFVMGIVLLLAESRSAWVGLAVAVSVGWWTSGPRRSRHRAASLSAVAFGIAALLLALLFVNPDSVVARLAGTFQDMPTSRVVIWRETLPLVRDFWSVGTGAGTFGMAMTAYQETWPYFPHLREYIHFNQAHNHYLHVAAEGGVLLVVPSVAVILFASRVMRRALREQGGEAYWVRLGAVASLAGIAAQSVFEIPLIAPANALLAAVVLAIAVHRRDPSTVKHRPSTAAAAAPDVTARAGTTRR